MTDLKRRNFNKLLGASVAAVPLAGLVGTLPSHAQDKPMLDPESAQAKALQYMAESNQEGKNCANCTLFQGDAGAEAGPCPLFAESSVSTKAWCSAWVAKA